MSTRDENRHLDITSFAIEDVIAVLDFPLTKTDGKFLMDYIRWIILL